ncbi:hypothetical protein D3C87_697360 [compost metagenome]
MLAPACAVEAAIGRQQRRHRHALCLQPRRPRAVGAQARPARAAQGQHHGIGLGGDLARRRREAQRVRIEGPITHPAMPHVELHARGAQTMQPGAQQGRGLHVGREHAARGADEGLDAQSGRPLARLLRTEFGEQRLELRAALAEAGHEHIERLGVREVEAAAAGQQKLAAHRGHRVVHVHLRAGRAQHFGRHQAGRSAADDGDGRRNSHSRFTSSPCPVRNAARTVAPG